MHCGHALYAGLQNNRLALSSGLGTALPTDTACLKKRANFETV